MNTNNNLWMDDAISKIDSDVDAKVLVLGEVLQNSA